MKIWVRLEEWILVIIMSVICILAMANVVSRYVLNASFSFTEELTTNLFSFVIFIGAALLARENGHIGFALLTDFLPKPLKVAAVLLVGVLTSIFFGILLYYGWDMVMLQQEYGQRTPAMGLPAWLMGLSVPLGALLCLIRFWEGYWIQIKEINAEGGER